MRLSRYLFVPFSIAFALTACKQEPKLGDRLAKADRVLIVMDSIQGAVQIEGASLDSIRQLPSGKAAERLRCLPELGLYFMSGKDTVASCDYHAISKIAIFNGLKEGEADVFHAPPAADAVLDRVYQQMNLEKRLNRFAWFVGKWTQTDPDGGVSFETWRRGDGGSMIGHAYTLKGADTTFEEHMELKVEEKDIYFVVTVDKEEGPVGFKLMEENGRFVSFEKKRSDFPQVISYRAIGDSGLFARISGFQGTEYGEVDFPLKRVRE